MINETFDEKMQRVSETAQKMINGEIKADLSYGSVEDFIKDINNDSVGS